MLCGLDRTVISILLASVLPNELGRDIQQDMKGTGGMLGGGWEVSWVERLCMYYIYNF